MDEFVPGNTDPQRRGRVAYERWRTTLPVGMPLWAELSDRVREAWCHAAEAAFEEGRVYELERIENSTLTLPAGEQLLSYTYSTAVGNRVQVDMLPATSQDGA